MRRSRREFLFALSSTAFAGTGLDSRQRVDRSLEGKDVDRPPFSAWHHFGLESQPPEVFAKATIEFHRQSGTDLIKVMSDFPYPKGDGDVSDLRVEASPFPSQIRALELIREGAGSQSYFLETIFNPWSVAEKLFSRARLNDLKDSSPQKLTDLLDVIARSEANHARLSMKAGASGIFLAIQNATPSVLSEKDYARFSEPFDKLILSSVSSAPLNTLHIHGSDVYWKRFTHGWPATAINYSAAATHVSVSNVRSQFNGVIMAGIDEDNFRKLTAEDLRRQALAARQQAGAKFILAPGCSVPNQTDITSIRRLQHVYT